jgi:nucleoside-diphosphate-sugar epimerase
VRVFVAGATGVLGLTTVQALVDAGHQVKGSARGADRQEVLRRAGAEPVSVDLFDLDAVRRTVAGSDAVLRLTTKIPPLRQWRRRQAWHANNRLRTEGARIMVDAALAEQVPVYVSESVSFVYADGGESWIDEAHPVDTSAASILAAAASAEAETDRFSWGGGRGVSLRFGGFYSANSEQSTYVLAMARRGLMPVLGPGDHYFSSIYVPDAARAVVAAIAVPAGVYNIGDDEPVRWREYLGAAAEAAGGRPPRRLPGFLTRLVLGPEVSGYAGRSHRVSNARFKAASGWKPNVPGVREGGPLVARAIAAQALAPA